jgi:hypothetical protein
VVNFATPAAPLHGLGSVCELPCGLTVLVGWVETDATNPQILRQLSTGAPWEMEVAS